MNNRLFIATHVPGLDDLRVRLEGYHTFDRYGDARLVERYKHFGFATVAPDKDRWLWRLLGCSYVYMPCGWWGDATARKVFAWAEFLNKRIIFEEDGRCR